jgi:hypothetical protein
MDNSIEAQTLRNAVSEWTVHPAALGTRAIKIVGEYELQIFEIVDVFKNLGLHRGYLYTVKLETGETYLFKDEDVLLPDSRALDICAGKLTQKIEYCNYEIDVAKTKIARHTEMLEQLNSLGPK